MALRGEPDLEGLAHGLRGQGQAVRRHRFGREHPLVRVVRLGVGVCVSLQVGYDPVLSNGMKTTPRRRDFIKGAVGLAAGLLAGSCLSDSSERSNRQPGSGPSGGGIPEKKGRTMIVDSHAYVFLPGTSRLGMPTPKSTWPGPRRLTAGHHQPAWRIRDRAPASSEPLAPGGFKSLSDLPDVNFRVDHERGRVVWTVDGEDFTKQFYPPNLRNLEFTPHKPSSPRWTTPAWT